MALVTSRGDDLTNSHRPGRFWGYHIVTTVLLQFLVTVSGRVRKVCYLSGPRRWGHQDLSYSLNSLRGLYRGLYRGVLQGLLRGILAV